MGQLMGGIYWVISQILLFWHGVWDKVLPKGEVLGTNWQWILAIVFLVVTVRIVLFPIFVKQIKSQRAMQALQPKMKQLQEKHKGDKESMQKELMELYKAEKVNPLMGCLPMFLQIPVFFGLFHVLKHLNPGIDKEHKELYGWTEKLFDSAASSSLFTAPIPAKFSSSAEELARLGGVSTPVKVVAAVLVIIMMVTTFLTSRQMILKTGWSEDPQQRMIQRLMLYGIPISLLVSGWAFPIGVIIYWVINNLISLGQQAWVLHKYPPPPSATKTTGTGGTRAGGGRDTANGRGTGAAARGGSTPRGGDDGKATRGGVLGRLAGGKSAGKAAENTTVTNPAAIEAKVRAPKPGAKPVNPKQGGPPKR